MAVRLLIGVVVVLGVAVRAGAGVPPRGVEGFSIERVDAPGAVRFPMFACFDERGRLFVTESSGLDLYAEISALTRKCRVSVLEDGDGDGKFEKAGVFAEGLVMPMGAAWRDGKLYVPDGPDLIALEDGDGDGKAEKRTVVLSGFGHLDNGGLHGITFGPDGWLYMTCGQPDGYRIKRADGTWMESKSGSLLRCRVDGSGVECLARGFENLVEVVFLGAGEVVGTVNWYQKPEGGVRDALVHLAHGGLYPYVPDVGTPQLVSGDVLPAVAKFPAVALSGLELGRGEGLGAETGGVEVGAGGVRVDPKGAAGGEWSGVGGEWVGTLYSAQHNTRKVGRHVLAREGATFRSEDFDFVTSDDPDFHPSDVVEDADGSLIVVDTGSWYIHHCPTGQIRNSPATGGVYRVRRNGVRAVEDARGLQVDWGAGAEDLVKLLADVRPVVRERARRELGRRGAGSAAALAAAMRAGGGNALKQRALWAAAGIADESAAALLRAALELDDADVVATAARALGSRRDRNAAEALARIVTSAAAPHVRYAAAEALAYCGDARSLAAVWSALASTSPADRFLEHSLIFAAHHLGDAVALTKALNHPHPRVQAAALLLLDQPPRPAGVLAADAAFDRLADEDEYLRRVALQRIEKHPEWAGRAVEQIRAATASNVSAEQEERLRRLVLAFEANPEVQALAAAFMVNGSIAIPSRVRMVEALGQSRRAKPSEDVIDALRRLIDSPNPLLAGAAVKTAAALRPEQLDERLARVAADERRPPAQRLDALRAVLPRRRRLDDASFALLSSRLRSDADPLDRLAAASLVGQARLDSAQARKLLEVIVDDAVVSPSAVLPALLDVAGDGHAAALASYLKSAVARGWEPDPEQLAPLLVKLPPGPDAEAVRAAMSGAADRRRSRLADFGPLLAGGDPVRGRAIFFGNKVACATCHRVGSDGGRVGPDLTKVGAVRAGRDILESVVLPSSTIAQGYDHYVVRTKSGEVHAGVVPQPSADVLEVRDSAGGTVRIHKEQVALLKRQPISLMPDGLPAALTRDEFRDLMAYLQSLR